jgi:hypothetical protein
MRLQLGVVKENPSDSNNKPISEIKQKFENLIYHEKKLWRRQN